MRRGVWIILGILLLVAPLLEGTAQAAGRQQGTACLFFTETGGFSVCDDGDARFRSAFERWGLQAIGYPVSQRYTRDGFVTQAFQKAIMQWRAESGTVVLVNIFDDLNRDGFDARLYETRQTPEQFPPGWDGAGLTFAEIVAKRQALLDARPALRAAYFASDDPLTFFGLPTSEVEDMGNHYAIRLQRAVLQEWKEAVPWARAGQVTIANGGDIAKELGGLPESALIPEAGAPAPVPTVPPTVPGAPPPLPTATDGRYPKPQAAGFTVSIVADSAERPIEHPTSLAWGADGALYVSRMEGPIVRVAPNGTRTQFATLDVPLGMAFRPGSSDLFVSHRGGITILRDGDGDGVAEQATPFITGMPCCYADLHQTNGVQFHDGWLYFAQGAASDHGEAPPEAWHAGILRAHPDAGQASLEYVATGLRNPYDLAIRGDGAIFATDNAADFGAPDELNHILPGQDYGWPDCFTSAPGVVDTHPRHAGSSRCGGTRAAIATFVPHASANGITAYEAQHFPAEYRGDLFVALWSHIEGAYRIVRVETTPQGDSVSARVTPFVTDFELPLDVAVGPDGALYVADWGPGRIYRIAYGSE